MKKRILIPIFVVLALVLLFIGGLWYMETHTMGLSVGRVLEAGDYIMLIRGNSPIRISNLSDNEELFNNLTDGDKVLVVHTGIAESYPAQTGVYAIFKLSDGSITDIPEDVLIQLNELGWRTAVKLELPESMPEDFSFALTWGCYGISSYDS